MLGISLIGACAIYKPARVLAPQSFGLTCPTPYICVEDPATLDTATALRRDAVAYVERTLGPMKNPPRLLFCSTNACAAHFGTAKVAGLNMGTYGSIINPVGWSDHIVRHEVIHHLQAERFGEWPKARGLPRWFIEGMAYAHSKDPRTPLPRADIEAWRAQYIAWEAAGNRWDVPPKP